MKIWQTLANRCFIFRVCKLLPESLRYWSCYLAVVDFRRAGGGRGTRGNETRVQKLHAHANSQEGMFCVSYYTT